MKENKKNIVVRISEEEYKMIQDYCKEHEPLIIRDVIIRAVHSYCSKSNCNKDDED